MNNLITSREYIRDILKLNKFAVLATESGGQPHVSLIAITPFGNFRQLIFATYRNTLKYRNLSNNSKVAILIENGDVNIKDLKEPIVLTIFGHTEEISIAENRSGLPGTSKETSRNGILHAFIGLCSYSGYCPVISGRIWD